MKCFKCSHGNVCVYYAELMNLNNDIVTITEIECKCYHKEG